MPTEFHLFPALPTELRQEIWSLAIRPNKSGVHIFRVYDTFGDYQTLPKDAIHFSTDGYPFRGHRSNKLGLALPSPDSGLACVNKPSAKSISTYMIDAGLWTACHESRSMMKKAFLTVKNVPRHDKKYIYKSLMSYYLLDGAPSYFTVRPEIDLFLLRPDSTHFALDYIDVDEALAHAGCRHIGFEYQSEWGQQLFEEQNDRGECLALDQIVYLSTGVTWSCIWLVDYNLKRKSDAPPCKNKGFYAGDRKLVEVDLLDEDSRNHWEYIEPVPDGEYRKSSFYFAEQAHWYYEEGRGNEPDALSIHFLGWEKY